VLVAVLIHIQGGQKPDHFLEVYNTYQFSELLQGIFKFDNVQNTSVTQDEGLNILIYVCNTFLCHHIQHL